jgi:hypothetical protein
MISDRVRLELQALRLHAYGPEGLDIRAIRVLARTPLWLETRFLLRSHGFSESEIAQFMNLHPKGCPCWQCVQALHNAVRASLRRRRRRGGRTK